MGASLVPSKSWTIWLSLSPPSQGAILIRLHGAAASDLKQAVAFRSRDFRRFLLRRSSTQVIAVRKKRQNVNRFDALSPTLVALLPGQSLFA